MSPKRTILVRAPPNRARREEREKKRRISHIEHIPTYQPTQTVTTPRPTHLHNTHAPAQPHLGGLRIGKQAPYRTPPSGPSAQSSVTVALFLVCDGAIHQHRQVRQQSSQYHRASVLDATLSSQQSVSARQIVGFEASMKAGWGRVEEDSEGEQGGREGKRSRGGRARLVESRVGVKQKCSKKRDKIAPNKREEPQDNGAIRQLLTQS